MLSEIETILLRGLLVTAPIIPAVVDIFLYKSDFSSSFIAILIILALSSTAIFSDGGTRIAVISVLALLAYVHILYFQDDLSTFAFALAFAAIAQDSWMRYDDQYDDAEEAGESTMFTSFWLSIVFGISVFFVTFLMDYIRSRVAGAGARIEEEVTKVQEEFNRPRQRRGLRREQGVRKLIRR